MPRDSFRQLIVVIGKKDKAPTTFVVKCSGEVDRDEKATEIYNNTNKSEIKKLYGVEFNQENDLILSTNASNSDYGIELTARVIEKENLETEDDEDSEGEETEEEVDINELVPVREFYNGAATICFTLPSVLATRPSCPTMNSGRHKFRVSTANILTCSNCAVKAQFTTVRYEGIYRHQILNYSY